MTWTTKTLDEICEINLGKTPSRSNKFFWDIEKSGINKWVSIADLTSLKDKFIYDSKEYISDKGASLFRPVKKGTLMMSFKLSIGKLAYAGCDIYTNEAIVSLPIRDSTIISKEYLYYYLNFYDWDKETENDIKLKGKTLNKAKLKKIKIVFPSLLIQQKIVEKLDAIFAEIDKAVTATEANIKNAEALFQSYLREIFEHGKENWKEIKLNEIAEYFNGLTYSPKDVSDSGIIVLRSSNVQNDKLDFNDIVRVNLKVKDKLIVRDGDILMCSRNGSKRLVGKTATIMNLNETMTFGTFMMIVRSKFNPFLEWFFKSNTFKKQISGGEVTMINQITRYLLDDVSLHLPEDNQIDEVTKKISDIFVQSRSLQSFYLDKLSELATMRRSVLNQAFNPVN